MTPEQVELDEKWIAALRSGNYLQGAGFLKDANGNYCCLGVLADICGIQSEQENTGSNPCYLFRFEEDHALWYPPKEWFEGKTGLSVDDMNELVAKNDGGYTFNDIAFHIECMVNKKEGTV